MATFKETRKILLASYPSNIITIEEYALLFEENSSSNSAILCMRPGNCEGLCMLLKQYSFPCRYSDMIPIFGRPVPELCMICNTVTDWIYAHHSHRITQWNRTILNPLELEKYAEAVFNQGAPLSNCFGFVDGTVRPITRLGENQRLLYNGHKRVHGLKFQSVVLPNGLISHLYGPVGKA